MRSILQVSVFSTVLLGASLAFAQPRDSRREFDALLRSAVQHYEAGQAREAIVELERAYAIRPLPRLLYNLGRAHERAGSFSTAVDYYNRFLQTNPDAQAGAIAREAMATAQRRAAEAQQAEQARLAAEQAAQQQALEAARAQAAEAERLRAEEERRRQLATASLHRRLTVPVLATGGVAAAAAIAGGVLGGLALSAQSDFNASHAGNDRASAYDRGGPLALGADIAFGTALVAGVVAVVLYFTQTPVADEAP
ncbi:MAG: tetratricopeptide repeat protein [Deltaproteobacteria bacterium]|jgi:tetratricopeptide (TPR) repeat protein|nr:tetratricopeptide repeat protein [Deltaproteobacteria bacterium]